MAERGTPIVHTQGDPSDILFQMPPLSRELREGDVFKYTSSAGTVAYKIENVDYQIEQISGGTVLAF